MVLVQSSLDPITVIDKLKDLVASEPWQVRYILRVLTVQLVVPIFFFFKQKTAYEITVGLEFRRVLFRSRWAVSGALPPALASRFTTAENAVLAVVSAEVRRHGACTLTVGHIAALAGVSETTVRNAVREARALGLVQVEERRISA